MTHPGGLTTNKQKKSPVLFGNIKINSVKNLVICPTINLRYQEKDFEKLTIFIILYRMLYIF